MPYQNKEQAKEAARLRKQKQRERDKGVTKTPENVTHDVTPEKVAKAIGVDKLHPIIYKLIDPTWRLKMYKLIQSLEKRKNLESVFVGYPGMGGVSMNDVRLYLEATEGIA